MKTTFLVIFICIFTFPLFAQLEKGTFLFGGGLSANSTHDEYSGDFFGNKYEVDELSFSFYPEIGYFVIENLVLGLNSKIGVSGLTYNSNEPSNPETNSNSFEYLFGPYIRYYYPLHPFALFGELNYQLGKRSQSSENYIPDTTGQWNLVENENKMDVSLFSPAIGVEYFINKSIGLSAALRYENGKREYNQEDVAFQEEYNYEQKNYGFVFLIALQIHLNFSETN
jgi:hypothetical protein